MLRTSISLVGFLIRANDARNSHVALIALSGKVFIWKSTKLR